MNKQTCLTISDPWSGSQHQFTGSSFGKPLSELQTKAAKSTSDDVGMRWRTEGATDRWKRHRGQVLSSILLPAYLYVGTIKKKTKKQNQTHTIGMIIQL